MLNFTKKKQYLYLAIFIYALILLCSGLLMISFSSKSYKKTSEGTDSTLVVDFTGVNELNPSDDFGGPWDSGPGFYLIRENIAIISLKPSTYANPYMVTNVSSGGVKLSASTKTFEYAVSVIDPAWSFVGVWRACWMDDTDGGNTYYYKETTSAYGSITTGDSEFKDEDGYDSYEFFFYKNSNYSNSSITYNANGGTMPSSSYTTSFNKWTALEDITLPTPTRNGYTFEGWQATAGISGTYASGSMNNCVSSTVDYGWGFKKDNNVKCYFPYNYSESSSYSKIKVIIRSGISGTFNILAMVASESSWDYPIFSNLNQTLSTDNTADSTYKIRLNSMYLTPTLISYSNVSAGDFIEVKYRKDGSVNMYWDRVYIKFVIGTSNNITFKAIWKRNNSMRFYNINSSGNTYLVSSNTYKVGQYVPSSVSIPSKTGGTFCGYYKYTNSTSEDEKIYDASGNWNGKDAKSGSNVVINSSRQWNFENDINLYAQYSYSITLDENYSGGNKITTQCQYYHKMQNIVSPTRVGYTFQGYWTTSASSGGTRYINADGTGNIYTLNNGTTLYARWQVKSYNVNIYKTEGVSDITSPATEWNLGTGKSVSVAYGSQFTVSVSVSAGYSFSHFNVNGVSVYSNPYTFTMPNNSVTIYAYAKANTYTVSFDNTERSGYLLSPYYGVCNSGSWSSSSIPNSSSSDYGHRISTFTNASSGAGNPYISSVSLPSGTKANWSFMAKVKSGTLTLEVGHKQSPRKTVTLTTTWQRFEQDFSSNGSQYSAMIFYNGWSGGETLYVKDVSVKLAESCDASYNVAPVSATYSKKWPSISMYPSTVPAKSGYVFNGYYTGQNGTGTKIYDENLYTVQTSFTYTNDVTLYSYWTQTLVSGGGSQPSGAGTQTNPYRISNADNLIWLSYKVSKGELANKYYKQTNDIDLSSGIWYPIGTRMNPFTGSYDGGFYKINGLHTYQRFSYADCYQGLFGYTNNVVLKNIYLSNAKIYGLNKLGCLAGQIDGTNSSIINCYVDGGCLIQSQDDNGDDIGGLVGGVKDLTITSSVTLANIQGGDGCIGSIIGHPYGKVTVTDSLGVLTSRNLSWVCGCYSDSLDDEYVSSSNGVLWKNASGQYRFGNNFSNWVYISGMKYPLPKGLSWLANSVGGETSSFLNDWTAVS